MPFGFDRIHGMPRVNFQIQQLPPPQAEFRISPEFSPARALAQPDLLNISEAAPTAAALSPITKSFTNWTGLLKLGSTLLVAFFQIRAVRAQAREARRAAITRETQIKGAEVARRFETEEQRQRERTRLFSAKLGQLVDKTPSFKEAQRQLQAQIAGRRALFQPRQGMAASPVQTGGT